ncbi:tetratricopeptide repeat protein [Coraliomargarita sp. SDUM461004]|uniref:Tetratricopeptide repeat protein n=1 Tax=Thalassobacterium sedimentorum TaxID=3041258 RepID=A0ABU1ANA8_9BACT|nr:tetratricopeptide repeat protein [Coraliomargarita sp. SDUM461004]MDQ8195678.1 tetratricopeptide repeat protein [Coraliomargarita sp. SDUM461004]
MPPLSLVEYALERSIEPLAFEDLCVDLLIRNGYREIVPAGGRRDHGRDAECRVWVKDRVEIHTAFQFSLEKKWENKLLRDIPTIIHHSSAVRSVVFVTSQSVTNEKQDKLREQLRIGKGIELVIYDRGWLLIQLECYYPDLVEKYFNFSPDKTVSSVESQVELRGLSAGNAGELFRNHSPESVRASFIARTQKQPDDFGAWKGLAHIENHLRNYAAALSACVRAERLMPDDINVKLLKATIWAEKGILEQSKPLLIKALEVYEWGANRLGRSVDFYNLANVQSDLGEIEAAEENYRKALALDPNSAKTWKNLGSVLFKRKKHEEELHCYEQALKLDGKLVEAYLCKANTLCVVFGKAEEAVRLFRIAYEIEPNLNDQWAHTPYWYATALADSGEIKEALVQIDSALNFHPDSPYMLNLKAALLSNLWDENPSQYLDQALEFFRFRVSSIHPDYPGLSILLSILVQRGVPEEGWRFIEINLGFKPDALRKYADRAGLSIVQMADGFAMAPQYEEFRDSSILKDHLVRMFHYGLNSSNVLEPLLNHLLMVPHRLMHDGIRDAVAAGSKKEMCSVFRDTLGQVSDIVLALGSLWLSETKPDEKSEQTRLLSLGVVYLAENIITETARLYGYYLGQFGFPRGQEPDGGDIIPDDFNSEVGVRFLDCVYKEWNLGGEEDS